MHIYFLSLLNIHPPTHTNLDLINVRRNIHILQDLITFFMLNVTVTVKLASS